MRTYIHTCFNSFSNIVKMRRLCVCIIICVIVHGHYSFSQKTCPGCGSMEVPYPLSTHPDCGDPDYALHCDSNSSKLYFKSMNGSSYIVMRIMASIQRIVVQPAPWVPGKCVTEDMVVSEGIWLNQSLPFNITSSNTIFFFNCSPRLLVSPINCSSSSLCHRYLESSGHIDRGLALECAGGLGLCCTFLAGGLPSAYKIRLHSSGCNGFRSILHLDPEKPASEWDEGLEIQWASPPEPVCQTQNDCLGGASKCSPGADGVFRCFCRNGYRWDHGNCSKGNGTRDGLRRVRVSVGVSCFSALAVLFAVIGFRKYWKHMNQEKLIKERRDKLKLSHGGNSARMFYFKEVKKATRNFSKDRLLGSGGF